MRWYYINRLVLTFYRRASWSTFCKVFLKNRSIVCHKAPILMECKVSSVFNIWKMVKIMRICRIFLCRFFWKENLAWKLIALLWNYAILHYKSIPSRLVLTLSWRIIWVFDIMQIPNVIAIGSDLNHKIDQCIVHVLFFTIWSSITSQ